MLVLNLTGFENLLGIFKKFQFFLSLIIEYEEQIERKKKVSLKPNRFLKTY